MNFRKLGAFCFVCFAGWACESAFSGEAVQLEVHEWGTFTILSGSDGVPLAWYQPQDSLSELPSFVYRPPNLSGLLKTGVGTLTLDSSDKIKAAARHPKAEHSLISSLPDQPIQGRIAVSSRIPNVLPAIARMETPVIYMYANRPTPVLAHVEYTEGVLTEMFPAPNETLFGNNTEPNDVTWQGELLPPSDPHGPEFTPKVTTQGAHYAHAREVPDAWWFKSKSATNVCEKFIFYRGVGVGAPPVRVSAPDNHHLKFTVDDPGVDRQGDYAFALQIHQNRARWCVMPLWTSRLLANDKVQMTTSEVDLDTAKEQSLAEVQEGIGAAMQKALVREGLTEAEARAMIATWRDLWFREDGTRILALLPTVWVNHVLPLNITPTPTTMRRVFVGRLEVFMPKREETLLTLLQEDSDIANSQRLALEFQGLKLGRFAAGALTRAQGMLLQRSSERFDLLKKMTPFSQASN